MGGAAAAIGCQPDSPGRSRFFKAGSTDGNRHRNYTLSDAPSQPGTCGSTRGTVRRCGSSCTIIPFRSSPLSTIAPERKGFSGACSAKFRSSAYLTVTGATIGPNGAQGRYCCERELLARSRAISIWNLAQAPQQGCRYLSHVTWLVPRGGFWENTTAGAKND